MAALRLGGKYLLMQAPGNPERQMKMHSVAHQEQSTKLALTANYAMTTRLMLSLHTSTFFFYLTQIQSCTEVGPEKKAKKQKIFSKKTYKKVYFDRLWAKKTTKKNHILTNMLGYK